MFKHSLDIIVFEGELMKKYIVFNLVKSFCAVEHLKIKEVIATSAITPVPMNPSHIKGIINLRGEVIPVIDLRLKMQMKIDPKESLFTVIICEVNEQTVGVIVDNVSNVTSLKSDDLCPVPEHFNEFKNSFIEGVAHENERLLLLLNLESILGTSNEKQTHLKIA